LLANPSALFPPLRCQPHSPAMNIDHDNQLTAMLIGAAIAVYRQLSLGAGLPQKLHCRDGKAQKGNTNRLPTPLRSSRLCGANPTLLQ
jgi:hypothetical protein